VSTALCLIINNIAIIDIIIISNRVIVVDINVSYNLNDMLQLVFIDEVGLQLGVEVIIADADADADASFIIMIHFK